MREQIDPRSKMAVAACLSTLAILYRTVLPLLLLFVLSVGILILFSAPLGQMIKRMRHLLKLLLVITLAQSIFTPGGTPLVSCLGIPLLTDYGVAQGLAFLLRMGIILMLAVLLSTAQSHQITQGLIQMKLPYEIAFMSTLGGKMIPIFKEEFVDSLNSFLLRGVDIKSLSLREKVHIYSYILTPVFTNSILRAKQLSIALELRGFRITQRRTSIVHLTLHRADYAIISLSAVAVLVGMAGRFL